MATSSVDATFPPDGEKVSKSEFRAQMLIIKNELSYLLGRIGLSGALAFGAATVEEVSAMIKVNNDTNKVSYARDIAFGRVSL
jgi:hypothetical protein